MFSRAENPISLPQNSTIKNTNNKLRQPTNITINASIISTKCIDSKTNSKCLLLSTRSKRKIWSSRYSQREPESHPDGLVSTIKAVSPSGGAAPAENHQLQKPHRHCRPRRSSRNPQLALLSNGPLQHRSDQEGRARWSRCRSAR